MTVAQAQAELAQINTAIGNILSGGVQSYDISGGGGRRIKVVLNINQLYARQRDLNFFIDRMSNGMVSVVQMRDPE